MNGWALVILCGYPFIAGLALGAMCAWLYLGIGPHTRRETLQQIQRFMAARKGR